MSELGEAQATVDGATGLGDGFLGGAEGGDPEGGAMVEVGDVDSRSVSLDTMSGLDGTHCPPRPALPLQEFLHTRGDVCGFDAELRGPLLTVGLQVIRSPG